MNFLYFLNRPWFNKDRFTTIEAFMIAYLGLLLAIIGYQGDRIGAITELLTGQVIQQTMQTTATLAIGQSEADFGWAQGYRLWLEMDTLGARAWNADDKVLSAQYDAVRDKTRELTPLLQPPYFDGTGELPRIEAFESDIYLVENTLQRQHLALTIDQLTAWSDVSDKYGLMSNILTAGLLLTGLMVTVIEKDSVKRFAFGIVVLMALYATLQLALIVNHEIPTRPEAAMQLLAEGRGLRHQREYDEAIAAFTAAIELDPTYIEAYVQRGFSNRNSLDEGDRDAKIAMAIADLEVAVNAGRTEVEVIGALAEAYYLQGQFADAQRVSSIGIENTDDFIHTFDLGRSILASGDITAARYFYVQGMAEAVEVFQSEIPSSMFWRNLDLVTIELDALVLCAEEKICEGAPPYETLKQPAEIAVAARYLGAQVKSLSMSLDLKDTVPSQPDVPVTASELRLSVAEDDKQDETTFIEGISEIELSFDYQNAPPDATIVIKVFIDESEYVPLRQISTLKDVPDGTYTVILNPGIELGTYTVQVYIDGHWVQQKNFDIVKFVKE